MELIFIAWISGIVLGSLLGFSLALKTNDEDRLRAIEKDLSESYRGETFEKRAKRASK